MTIDERKEKIKFIKGTIEGESLSYVWLIARLRERGIETCKSTLSSVLSQSVSGPKAERILSESEMICHKYCNGFAQGESNT